MNFSNTNTSNRKQRSRYNKALSANKYNQKLTINNNNELNDKIIYDFCKKHPGYLYYKEIIANKKKRNCMNKTRALTGNIVNRKMKLEPLSKIGSKNLTKKLSKNEYFPKISKSNSHIKNSIISKQTYYNHNYFYDFQYVDYCIYCNNILYNQPFLTIITFIEISRISFCIVSTIIFITLHSGKVNLLALFIIIKKFIN